jgi:excisionase family DNA binding protein
MTKLSVSPKELAQAIGVSESSLKRWADEGVLRAVRTPGGHRRIPVPEAVRFIRDTGSTLIRPDILGFADALPATGEPIEDLSGEVIGALLTDDALGARQLLLGEFLAGRTVAALCDGPMRESMAYVGELWQHREDGVLIEHRATDIWIGVLQAIRSLLPIPGVAATATGGAPETDPYLLPSLMVDTVLAGVGYKTHNLGPETPITTQRLATARYGARLAWRSYSIDVTADEVLADFNVLLPVLENQDGHFVVGGRGLDGKLKPRPRLHIVSSMTDLATVGHHLLDGLAP